MVDEQHDAPPRMAIPAKSYGFPPEAFDWTRLPDIDTDFLPPDHIEAFIQALEMHNQHGQPSAENATHSVGSSRDTLSSHHRPGITKRHSLSAAASAGSSTPLPPGDPKDGEEDSQDGDDESQYGEEDPQVVAALAAAASADVPAPAPEELQEQAQQQQQQQQQASSHEAHRSNGTLSTSVQSKRTPIPDKTQHGTSHKRPRRRLRLGTLVGTRSKDETREGHLYGLLKWPLLVIVGTIVIVEAIAYLAVRLYISMYEYLFTWRGRREALRQAMRATNRYSTWKRAALGLDDFLGREKWKEEDAFAYYDSITVKRVQQAMAKCRMKAEEAERALNGNGHIFAHGIEGYHRVEGSNSSGKKPGSEALEDLRMLVGACVKDNFVGIESPKLYSQTYYGTKNLAQKYVEEVEASLQFLLTTQQLPRKEKGILFNSIRSNYGRTALCLSGGATFAFYHFGTVKAFLDADLLPDIITGTSGGAVVAALVATRTNDELKQLLVPALARRLTACEESYLRVGLPRSLRTGARFDTVDWARKCAWFCRGSMTFREAHERTGRILNVGCVSADAHSPPILCNYQTTPDCVIWSAVIASSAVPLILNPVVLMMKTRDTGELLPYSFGHKWKDGSLRTDIPIEALKLGLNVNFPIVSQVNPHVSAFFFSSRGAVGRPVTHRKGRGWRGGYVGSAAETFLKFDLIKLLKLLRGLELLPRPFGQDWSQIWLQPFGGTVTIWPKTEFPGDLIRILTDPDEARLARMLHEGQQAAFPVLKFISNRLRIERLIDRGLRENQLAAVPGVEIDMNGGGGTSSETYTDESFSVPEEDDEEE